MKIIVYSEYELYNEAKANKISDKPYIIISIRDRGRNNLTNLKTFDNVKDVLNLLLDDTLDKETGMCESDAKEIHDFISKHEDDIGIIAIHCFAGQSRSYTIGKVLSGALGAELIVKSNITRINELVQSRVQKYFK